MTFSQIDQDLADRWQAEHGGTVGIDVDGGVSVYDYASFGGRRFSTGFKNGSQRRAEPPVPGSFHSLRPPAANDNKPGALNLSDWSSSSFQGDPEPPEYLVGGVIESGIPAMVAAMGEVGKSFSLLELCRRVAFGHSGALPPPPIFGGQVVQEGTAVYIAGEDDRKALHRRLAAIDSKAARLTEKGDKLIAVPMPSAVSPIKPYWTSTKGVLGESDDWRRLTDQLAAIDDLKVVVIDPLQLFASLPLNEDPAAGQFVCASIASLAAQTGANVFVSHHMNKSGKAITNLAEARDAIRGTTALVDGVRLAYALWYPEEARAKGISKAIGSPHAPNRIVLGGVVKANGAANRILSTYARNDFGLLVDQTARLGAAAPSQGDQLTALIIAVEAAAAKGQPFTKTGVGGLFKQKARLPDDLSKLSRSRLEFLADQALEARTIVAAVAKGSKIAMWLDVPSGPFAAGLGQFKVGIPR